MSDLIPIERIEKAILFIRGHKVLLDTTLAELYGVTTKRLNEQVRRNVRRFPSDFMFPLTQEEYQSLRSHFATLETGRGRHRKYLPLAFTEQGVAMLSSVLNSQRAIDVNIVIMRTFVRLRQRIGSQRALAKKLVELEKTVGSHGEAIKSLFAAIHGLMNPDGEMKKVEGFKGNES